MKPAKETQASKNLIKEKTVIVWFRKCLRLRDNLPLIEACKFAKTLPECKLLPLFIIDPNFANPDKVGLTRYNFLLESLRDLDEQLRDNYKSRLVVLRGPPFDVFNQLIHNSTSKARCSATNVAQRTSKTTEISKTVEASSEECTAFDGISDSHSNIFGNIINIYFESDTEPYAESRDSRIQETCANLKVGFHHFTGHTLYDVEDVIKQYKGVANVTINYSSFVKHITQLGPPKQPLEKPEKLPPLPSAISLDAISDVIDKCGIHMEVPELEEMGFEHLTLAATYQIDMLMTPKTGVDAEDKSNPDTKLTKSTSKRYHPDKDRKPSQNKLTQYLKKATPDRPNAIPKSPSSPSSTSSSTPPSTSSSSSLLPALGYKHPSGLTGGEREGLKRLSNSMKDKKWVAMFEKPQTDPTKFDPQSTTLLSPYLKFGCISPRDFYWRLIEVYNSHKVHTSPPVSLLGQLYWREFYYLFSAITPNYDKMKDNHICRQIPWDDNREFVEAWEMGRTGYPWIDAIMNQLRLEGWMHHLARHCVACFLTRGQLYCSWEEGARIFDKYLIDADWAINNGNWMWLSASCFFYQYFRVYCPVGFAKKYDKTGKYVRRYVTALRNFPNSYIYEPWKAPIEIQKEAQCIIGEDYPLPIVDYQEAKITNMARMKKAYSAQKAAKGGEEDEGEDEEEEDDDDDYE